MNTENHNYFEVEARMPRKENQIEELNQSSRVIRIEAKQESLSRVPFPSSRNEW
jgi:hypothetical protein